MTACADEEPSASGTAPSPVNPPSNDAFYEKLGTLIASDDSPDPYDLYMRNEWKWDAWRDIMLQFCDKDEGSQRWQMKWNEREYNMWCDMCDPEKFTLITEDAFGFNSDFWSIYADVINAVSWDGES